MLATISSPTVSTDKADLHESAKTSTTDETGRAQHDQLCSQDQQASSSAATKASQPSTAKGRSKHYIQVGNIRVLVIRDVTAKRVTNLCLCKYEQNPKPTAIM